MADPGSQEAFQITPEEERFLRAFFRRHAGRYLLLGILVAGAAALALRPGGPLDGADSAQESAQGWDREAGELRSGQESLRGKLASLRDEARGLRAELETVAGRIAPPDDGAAQAARAELDERLAALARRVRELESRVAQVAEAPAAPRPELGELVERLDSVQARQEIEAQARENFEKSVLNRLYAVENRMAQEAPPEPGPGAPGS